MSEYRVIEGAAHAIARAGRARRASARRLGPCSLRGLRPPGPAALRIRARGGSSPEGQRAGTQRGQNAPTPGAHAPAPTALRKAVCARLLPLPGSPLGRRPAVAFSPLRVLPCRCGCALLPSPASGGRARPRCRGRRPSSSPSRCALAAAGPLPFPPPCALGPCAPLCGSVAARCRPCAVSSPLCAAGFLRSPLLPSGSPLRFGSARRVPPWSPPFGASGPGPPRPGARRRCRRAGGFAPGRFFCSGAAPPALCLRWVGFSPCAPPPRRPPPGGSGERVACGLGAAAPAASQLPRGQPFVASCLSGAPSAVVFGFRHPRHYSAALSARKGQDKRRAALAGGLLPRSCVLRVP